MTKEIARILRTEDRFLAVTHVNPDGDAIGSLLGLALALSEMGKASQALSTDKIPDMYEFLPGRELLVADPSEVAPAPNWIISVDAAEARRISGEISHFRSRAGLINIDHHPTNPKFGDLNLVEPHATSTAELIFQLLKEAGYALSPDVGKCLYTGLITDTGGFRFSGVNSRTLELGAEIVASGFEPYEVARRLFEEYPFTRLLLERVMLERMEMLVDGSLCLSTLYVEDFDRLGADKADTENLVDRLREIRGVEAGVLITEMSESLTRVSLRSKGRLDVSVLAKSFGGGGHRHAAGIKTALSPHEIKEKLIRAIEKALVAPANPDTQGR